MRPIFISFRGRGSCQSIENGAWSETARMAHFEGTDQGSLQASGHESDTPLHSPTHSHLPHPSDGIDHACPGG